MASRRSPRPRPLTRRRILAVGVLLVIAAFYVDPVQKYLRVTSQLRSQQAHVAALERRQAALQDRTTALEGNAGIIAAARACGWVFPGERPLVVTGLPESARAHCG
jgi:cell division protein FtsB